MNRFCLLFAIACLIALPACNGSGSNSGSNSGGIDTTGTQITPIDDQVSELPGTDAPPPAVEEPPPAVEEPPPAAEEPPPAVEEPLPDEAESSPEPDEPQQDANSPDASVPMVVALNWLPSPGEVDGYLIHSGPTPDTADIILTQTDSTSIVLDVTSDMGFTPGESACFRIKAFNAFGTSDFSSPVCLSITA